MPALPEAIIMVLAPFAPLFSQRVWLHTQVLLVGAILAPGARTVTDALRVMGLSGECHFTNYRRVLNRATRSTLHGSRLLLGLLMTRLVPSGATLVVGADDTVERRAGRKITARGCYRDAVRSSKHHVTRCFVLKWVSMMLLVPVPWSRRVWALPFLSALCWPEKRLGRRRHKTGVDWARQMIMRVCGWLPGRGLVLVVDGGFAVVSLAWACAKNTLVMVSRLLRDAALYHPPGLPAPGQRRAQTPQGEAPTELAGMGRALGYAVGDCGSGLVPRERKKLWVFSRTALWYTTRVPPVAPRHVLVVDLDGKLRMETFFCTDLQATPMEILDASQSLCRYTLSKRPKVELNGQRLLFPNFHLDLP